MMNHRSIKSSEIHVRSENVMRKWNHAFQKDVQHFLEDKELPYPSFQLLRSQNQTILSKFPFWAYKRPAHCRPCWMILREDSPMIFVETRDQTRGYTARIPFDNGVIQKYGSVCCEAYIDHQDRSVYVVDLLYWNNTPIYRTMPFHERWPLLNKVVYEVCFAQKCNDMNILVPKFMSLVEVSQEQMDPAVAIEFQPDTPDKRRFLYIHREASHAQAREVIMRDVSQVQKAGYGAAKVAVRNTQNAELGYRTRLSKEPSKGYDFVDDKEEKSPVIVVKKEEIPKNETKPLEQPSVVAKPGGRSLPAHYFDSPAPVKKVVNALPPRKTEKSSVDKSLGVAICKKDPVSKLPDCYRLYDSHGNDIGLAALRLFAITQKVRTAVEGKESCKVSICWHEPFGKFEIKDVLVE